MSVIGLASPAFIAHKSVVGNPSHRATTGGFSAGNATTQDVAKPPGTLPHDRLVLSVGFASISTRKPVPPAGSSWEIVDGPAATFEPNNGMVMAVYEAWSRDIDSADLTGWTTTDGVAVLWAWHMTASKDVNQATPDDVPGAVDPDSVLNAAITCPQLTTVTDNSLVIAVGIDVLQGAAANWGAPLVEVYDAATVSRWTHSAALFNKTPAGLTGFPAFSRVGSNGRGVGATVALRPAA